MANKYKNEFDATIGGTTYKLRATFDAMVAIEEATGMALPQLGLAFSRSAVKASHIIGIITAASVEDVDVDELKENILVTGIIYSALTLSDFFSAALYGVPEEKKQ